MNVYDPKPFLWCFYFGSGPSSLPSLPVVSMMTVPYISRCLCCLCCHSLWIAVLTECICVSLKERAWAWRNHDWRRIINMEKVIVCIWRNCVWWEMAWNSIMCVVALEWVRAGVGIRSGMVAQPDWLCLSLSLFVCGDEIESILRITRLIANVSKLWECVYICSTSSLLPFRLNDWPLFLDEIKCLKCS